MFENVTPTTTQAAPVTASSTTPDPLDQMNPFSTSNPLNPGNPNHPLNKLTNVLGELSSNVTDAVNEGLSGAMNGVVERVVDQIGVKDFYYIYLQKVCSGAFVGPGQGNTDGVKVDDCRSWEDAERSKKRLMCNFSKPG